MSRYRELRVEALIEVVKSLEHRYNLNETKKEILKLLFRKKEMNRYEIKKELQKVYSAIHNYMKELLEKNLIKVSREELRDDKPLPVKYYTLTKTGLTLLIQMIIAGKLKNKDVYIYPSREILHEIEKDIKPILKHKELLEEWQQKLSDQFLVRQIIDQHYHGIIVTKPELGLASIPISTIERYSQLIEGKLKPIPEGNYYQSIPQVDEYYVWLREKLTENDITILLNYIANLAEKEHKRYLKLAEEFKTYVEKTKKLLSTLT